MKDYHRFSVFLLELKKRSNNTWLNNLDSNMMIYSNYNATGESYPSITELII